MAHAKAPAPWRNRIVGSGEVDPSELKANPHNWRVHPPAQQSALEGALDQVGWVQQVLINKRTGNMIDGHARVERALARSEPTVPVLYVDLDPGDEALVLATLDPLGAMATVDSEKLDSLVARGIEYSTRPGDVVYDPFVGSGTTIIAAEQLGRRALALEIDRRYAQVSIERWELFTGRQAECLEGPADG